MIKVYTRRDIKLAIGRVKDKQLKNIESGSYDYAWSWEKEIEAELGL